MIRPLSGQDFSRLLQFNVSLPRARATGRFDNPQSTLLTRSLTDLSGQLGVLRNALESLQSRATETAASRSRSGRAARVGSSLALQAAERPTRLSSTEEVNSVATSFSPFGPVVSGTTTSLPTIGGVYTGSEGDDTLTFEFRRNAAVGSGQRLDVRVYNSEGDRLETLRFADLPAGTPVALSNGLTLSLGEGAVSRNDTFEVQVSATVGSQVDPTKPFDGLRNAQPNFEPGASVVDGSFEVNGAVIAVSSSDSIDSVLARINASSAGVTASFDAGSERVVLSHDTPGPTPTIVLTNDTSNFLTATKLAGATAVAGEDETLANNLISQVPALSGVSDGTFSVNGVEISVDTASDSLEDVIDRINASGAGATAVLDRDTSLLSIVSQARAKNLVLDDRDSGLFTAIGVAPKVYEPVEHQAAGRVGFERLPGVEKNLRDLGRVLDGLFSPPPGRLPEFGTVRDRLRDSITSSFESALGVSPRAVLRSGFGLDFDFTKDRNILELDRGRFEATSIEEFGALHDFLFREDDSGRPQGLLTSLLGRTDELIGYVQRRLDLLDPKGRFVDLFA